MPNNSFAYKLDQQTSSSSSPSASELFPRFRSAYDAPNEPWQVILVERLARLARLDQNWDTYGAPPIRADTGMFALSMLESCMRSRTPAPQVAPSSDGGLQIEWHKKDIDLEIRVTDPYKFDLWFEDHRTGETLCKELGADLSDLKHPIELLTAR